MKKITLSLVATSLITASLGVDAAIATSAAPFQVIVPNLMSGIEFTLEGLYIQPTNSNLTYVSTTIGASPSTTNNTSLTPNYDFGFAIGVGYIFPNAGNDAQVNWTHFDHNTTDSVISNAGVVTNVLGGIDVVSPDTNGAVNTASDVSFQYDAVDLDVGQYLSIGTRLQTRLFAGLRYVNLKNGVADTSAVLGSSVTTPTQDALNTTITFDSKFTGVGPRAGIDTSYRVFNCFGVVAHFATALLVGRVESSTSNTADAAYFTTSNQTRVIPGFDAKLGLNYTMGFKNGASNATVEAGYQVTQYMDVIDRLYNAGTTVTSSVGFNGPYLSLNFKV